MFNRKSFQEWKGSRHQAAFQQYLRDFSEALARKWAQGVEMSPEQQMQAKLFLELADLEWADVARFYEIDEPEESGAQ